MASSGTARSVQHVLIVDDHPLFRDALRAALGRLSHRQIAVHEAQQLADADLKLAQTGFDLVLLDLQLNDGTGFEGLARIKALRREIGVAIVSATETADAIATATAMGAQGYLPKSMTLETLTTALDHLLDGEVWFPQCSADASSNDMREQLASLTPAQLRVIRGLSDGLLNKQIAFEMGISEATVKAHMTAILRKLGANNRTQALLAYKQATSLN